MDLPQYDESAPIRPTEVRKGVGYEAERVDFDSIPIVDIGAVIRGDAEGKRQAAAALRDAAANVGFFYIKNHGVPEDVIRKAQTAADRFYALPVDVKKQYDVALSKRHRGYVPVGGLSADPTTSDLQEG